MKVRGRRCLITLAAMALLFSSCSDSDPDGLDVGSEPTPAPDRAAAESAPPESVESAVTTTIAPSTTTTSPAPTPSTAPPLTTDDGDPPPPTTASTTPNAPVTELDRLVDELVAFVEVERGHTFVSRPVVERIVGDDFVAEYAAVLAREAERHATEYRDATDIYQALGIIDESQDLLDIFASFADAGVLAFYDHPTERIVLRDDELNALTETVLVHELVHALDDQIFDLDREEYDDRTDEVGWTFRALLEGNATVIEDRYRQTLTAAELAEERDARRALPRGVPLSAFTDSFLELQFSPYEVGERWVGGLWASGGRPVVDATFEAPPETSEQVIRAGSSPDVESPDPAAPPPVADQPPFDAGIFGQVAWNAILLDSVDPVTAAAAADGWGGDWYVAWREGDRACVRAHVAADSPADLDEMAAALEWWAADGDRDIFYPTADLIRVTACG